MNLIEELGGYENAKDEWLREGAYPSPNYFYYRQLWSELLNYRRANNIYEVGDKVVLKESHSQKSVLTIQMAKDDFIRAFVGGSTKYSFGHKTNFIHATDKQIEAGYRIDENVDHCTDIRNHISPLTGVIER